jgi:hypothetical protein
MRALPMMFAGLLLASGTAQAFDPPLLSLPRSGSLTWGHWSFDWTVGDNSEGLELKHVKFKGVSVLFKASMPVIRVKYRGDGEDKGDGCGPYSDQIDWCNMEVLSGAFSNVVARIFDDDLLEIAVFAQIGGYDLYQAWYFDKGGTFQPMLYSSGWSCGDDGHENDHRHHPYWRLDFDVETTDNQVWQLSTPPGQGTTSTRKDTESSSARTSSTELAWKIKKSGSSKHVLIQYSNNERRDEPGNPWFSFVKADAGWRRYHSSEDVGWEFDWDGHLGYDSPAESTNKKDIVFWAVGHLTHTWSLSDENHPEWHSTGPVITVVGF